MKSFQQIIRTLLKEVIPSGMCSLPDPGACHSCILHWTFWRDVPAFLPENAQCQMPFVWASYCEYINVTKDWGLTYRSRLGGCHQRMIPQ